MNTTSSQCQDISAQPSGVGIDSATLSFKACSDQYCSDCSSNYANCTKCYTDKNYFLNETTGECQLSKTKTSIPGFRFNPETGVLEKCKESNCTKCDEDASICEACDVENGFSKLGNKCILSQTTSPIHQWTKFISGDSKAVIEFKGIEFQSSWADQLDIMLLDVLGNQSYTDPNLFTVNAVYLGFEVHVHLQKYIEVARLYMTKKQNLSAPQQNASVSSNSTDANATNSSANDSNATSSNVSNATNTTDIVSSSNIVPDEIFPIIVNDFTLFNEKTQRMIAEATTSTVESLDTQRAVFNIVLMNVNMNVATLLDRLLADYEYQGLIGKQNLTYIRLLLDPALKVKLVPFDLPGTDKETKEGIVEQRTRYECSTIEYFYFRNNVKCGFLQNYGTDLITLVFILVVTSLIFTLGFWLRRQGYLDDDMPEPSEGEEDKSRLKFQLNKLGCSLTVSFGLQFFFAKMETNAMKILIFCFLNIYKVDDSWQMGVGILISFIMAIYFGIYVAFALTFAKHLKSEVVQQVKSKNEIGKFRQGPLKTSLKMHLLKYGFMSKPYEELRNDLNFFEIYYPVVLILRDILISFSIVMLTGKPQASPILTALIEFALLIFCLVTRARSNRVENGVDIFNCICRMVYSILAAATFSYDHIPVNLDIAMFVCLLFNTFGVLFLTTYIVLLQVYGLLALILAKSLHQNRFKNSEERIKTMIDEKFFKFRTEVLAAIDRKPALMEKRLKKFGENNNSLKPLLANPHTLILTELIQEIEEADHFVFDECANAGVGLDLDERRNPKSIDHQEISKTDPWANVDAGHDIEEFGILNSAVSREQSPHVEWDNADAGAEIDENKTKR